MSRYISGRGDVNIDSKFQELGDTDTSVVLIQFNNGALGTIENCSFACYGVDARAELFGSDGGIDIGTNFDNKNGYQNGDKLNMFKDTLIHLN